MTLHGIPRNFFVIDRDLSGIFIRNGDYIKLKFERLLNLNLSLQSFFLYTCISKTLIFPEMCIVFKTIAYWKNLYISD